MGVDSMPTPQLRSVSAYHATGAQSRSGDWKTTMPTSLQYHTRNVPADAQRRVLWVRHKYRKMIQDTLRDETLLVMLTPMDVERGHAGGHLLTLMRRNPIVGADTSPAIETTTGCALGIQQGLVGVCVVEDDPVPSVGRLTVINGDQSTIDSTG